jgi:ligand-binding SRPBCC domain-containing protein
MARLRRVQSPIEVVTVIGATVETVFDLELDVDAHAASLPGTGETATTSTGRSTLGLGDEVTFRARHFGIRWTMTTKVTVHERPHRFVDEQVRGPFRSLRHEHVFEVHDGTSTRMTDRMDIALPLGPPGKAAVRFVLIPYMRRLLQRRACNIKREAERITDVD